MNSKKQDISTAASSTSGSHGNLFTSELEEPDTTLMEKLGVFLSDHRTVKTTTHHHPMLSHHSLVKQKKKNTTSPASTLSDKGIGSSVGSFDSEFRQASTLNPPPKLPYDPSKTGSLDSRTYDAVGKPVSAHMRSSSDIIGTSTQLPNMSFTEQLGAPLWNSDPRRSSFLSADTATSSLTSLIQSRKPSIKRQKARNETNVVKDAEIKKLPQLFRPSPASSRSSLVSSTSSLTVPIFRTEDSNKLYVSISSADSTLTEIASQSDGATPTCDVTINFPTPPTPNGQPPPLPPKTSLSHRSSPNPSSTTNDDSNLLFPGSKPVQNQPRPRLMSDGAAKKKMLEGAAQSRVKIAHGVGRHRGGVSASWDGRTTASGPYEVSEELDRGSVRRSSIRSTPGAFSGIHPYRPQLVDLQPLVFELHQAVTSEQMFIGRDWLFVEITRAFSNDAIKGVMITGRAGQGKTSIIHHLASNRYHGWSGCKDGCEQKPLSRTSSSISRSSSPMMTRRLLPPGGGSCHSSRTASPVPSLGSAPSSRAGSVMSLVDDTSRKLAAQVVAFHFCQCDNNATCQLPEFIHNIASQMAVAPQLTAYRELLISEPALQKFLTFQNCLINPSNVWQQAIIEPLQRLKQNNRLPNSNLIILIDSVTEPKHDRSDYGYSILSFLQRHLEELPGFIKLVMTCRDEHSAYAQYLPVHFLSLDESTSHIDKDVQLYTTHRISTSDIMSNLSLAGKPDQSSSQKQLTQHFIKTSQGNFLYLRLCLDLIDRGAIVLKSSGFKVIPRNLHEICLLLCNLNFRSYTSFDEVRGIISIALATLYPLNDEQIYQVVCCGVPPNQLPWAMFKQSMSLLNDILVTNPSGRRSFFHPCIRRWFMGIREGVQENGQLFTRFRVDIRDGHALLATVLSRQPPERMHKDAMLELAHHVIKADMFNDQSANNIKSLEQNAKVLAETNGALAEALTAPRSLLFPNLMVIELLLRAGANPNQHSQILSNAPPIAVASKYGFFHLVNLLLRYGADVNVCGSNGMTALSYAAFSGHFEIVKLLLNYQPTLSMVDLKGNTALLHAVAQGHSNVVVLLLSRDLYPSKDHHLVAVQQAFVAASAKDNIDLINYLLDESDFDCDVNFLESSLGESPLTTAAAHGQRRACEILIRRYRATPNFRNRSGLTPLLCAVKHGKWDAVDVILACGAPVDGRGPGGKTPLILAAFHGETDIVLLLLSRGADCLAVDDDSMTSLSWASKQGHAHCVQVLIEQSDLDHSDVRGRTALHLAAQSGSMQIVELLLLAGCNVHHRDVTGLCALEHAVESRHANVVARLLRHGAEINDVTWMLADGKLEVMHVLLRHCLEIGNSFYRNMDFVQASEMYAGALKHVSEPNAPKHDSVDVVALLLLNFSRAMRKLGKLEEALSAATQSLELKPGWYEALYARARVLREKNHLSLALIDVIEAERNAPSNNLKEIRQLLQRIKEEIKKTTSVPSEQSANEMKIPQLRHANVSPSPLGNELHTNPLLATLSQAYHPSGTRNDGCSLRRENSQESLAESMASLSLPPPVEGAHLPPPDQSRAPTFYRSWSHDRNHAMVNRSMANAKRNESVYQNEHTKQRDLPKSAFETEL